MSNTTDPYQHLIHRRSHPPIFRKVAASGPQPVNSSTITSASFGPINPGHFSYTPPAQPTQPTKSTDLAFAPKARIKMIAVGMEFTQAPNEVGDLAEVVQSVPYVLTHDDRIFQYDKAAEDWTELPPLPE